jgi:hypothetical protein
LSGVTRRRLVLVAAAVLAFAAVGAVTWRVLEAPAPEPTPPWGTRYVGQDGVVFAVPEDWLTLPPTPCLTSVRPFVTFESSWTAFCPAMTEPLPPHVVIGRGGDAALRQDLRSAGLVPALHTLPKGWITVPWTETIGSFLPELDEVHQALERAGLEERVVLVHSRKLLDGTVLQMDPPMGSVVEEGGTITLTLTTIDAVPTAGASSSP